MRFADIVLTAAVCLHLSLGLSAPAAARPSGTDSAIRSTPSERSEIMSLVEAEARHMGVPVALALAVAHTESYFNPRVESHKGARGVMQIMPRTGWEEYGVHPDELWKPRLNIRIGLHFLRRLLERYRGRTDLALSYYNGGSAVGDLPHARVMPATRKYVVKVRGLERKYRRKLWAGGKQTWTRRKY